MNRSTTYKLIVIGTKLYCLGLLIEFKRKKLNNLIQKGCLLNSKEVRKANQALSPLILRWQILENVYRTELSLKPLPIEK